METNRRLAELLLALVPEDGSPVGNAALKQAFVAAAATAGLKTSDTLFEQIKDGLVTVGALVKGKGRGGSVRRLLAEELGGFDLEAQDAPTAATAAAKAAKPGKAKTAPRAPAGEAAQILSYRHPEKRKNNPEVGMVTPDTDPDAPRTVWQHDPHLDPTLSWTGKAERLSFEVDTVSLHVHERIDPMSILAAVRKDQAKGRDGKAKAIQPGLFDAPFESLPLRDAIDFYKHDKGWSNRLVAGDSLLVMNSLLQKESMAGRVQMIYLDPPYGIKYGSNFQPFVNKRDVKDRKDEDLTQEPEMIKAFRDTWELGIHSYLTYLRDRLLLAKELLNETGSVFVQISDENLHHTKEILDEVFGAANAVSVITVRKTGAVSSPDARVNSLATIGDFIIWYAKDKSKLKYSQLFLDKSDSGAAELQYRLKDEGGWYQSVSIESNGYADSFHFPITLGGREFRPAATRHWSTTEAGIYRAARAGRVLITPGKLRFKKYLEALLSG